MYVIFFVYLCIKTYLEIIALPAGGEDLEVEYRREDEQEEHKQRRQGGDRTQVVQRSDVVQIATAQNLALKNR